VAFPVLVVTALPLIYYFLLSKYDSSWKLAGEVNNFGRWPWWVTVVGLAPLAIPAAFAYLIRPANLGDWILRIWPLAGLAIFYLPVGTFPFHAFQGLALPLAVLAIIAVRNHLGQRPLPLLATSIAVAVLVVPGVIYRADQMRGAVNAGRQAFFLEPGERDAMRWLEQQPGPGGVLAPIADGSYIPAYTGRPVWIGAGSWTPDFGPRGLDVEDFFSQDPNLLVADRTITESGARFIFAPCRVLGDPGAIVAAKTLGAVHSFGCARVWELRAPIGGWR
jgi:hypothetical protein